MKIRIQIQLAVAAVLIVTVTACFSAGSVAVPGEKEQILKNLAAEYYLVAEGYLDNKNYTKAAEYYEYALRDESLYRQAYYKMGYSYALGKQWDRAELIYTDLVAQDPENMSLKESLAYILFQAGKTDEGLEIYESILEQEPYNQTVTENYIVALAAVERFDDAGAALTRAEEYFPDSTVLDTVAKKLQDAAGEGESSAENDNAEKSEKAADSEVIEDVAASSPGALTEVYAAATK